MWFWFFGSPFLFCDVRIFSVFCLSPPFCVCVSVFAPSLFSVFKNKQNPSAARGGGFVFCAGVAARVRVLEHAARAGVLLLLRRAETQGAALQLHQRRGEHESAAALVAGPRPPYAALARNGKEITVECYYGGP